MKARSEERGAKSDPPSSLLAPRSSLLAFPRPLVWLLVITLFLALRIPLLVVREPFFDELLTVWYAQKPLSQHWAILSRDSGAPTYYAVARATQVQMGFDVTRGRVLSLLFGLLAIAVILRFAQDDTRSSLMAAALLAVFPPHVFFSTEARAYALAGLFVGYGALLLHRWSMTTENLPLGAATLNLVLAAYTHSYGVLFFPLPFLIGLMTTDRRLILKGLAASAMTGLLFLPGFWLAGVQPHGSVAWMDADTLEARLRLLGGVIQQLSFAAPYPRVFLTPPPVWLQIPSVILFLAVATWGAVKSRDARMFALMTLVPVAAVLGFAVAGKTFYFPMRFESVLSVPLAVWLAFSLVALPGRLMRLAFFMFLAIGTLVGVVAIMEHASRPPDPYRLAADFVRTHARPQEPIVASGYAYLEVISQIDPARVMAFPAEQATHPGWVGPSAADQLRRESSRLPQSFVWVGTLGTAEARLIATEYEVGELFRESVVAVGLVRRKGR